MLLLYEDPGLSHLKTNLPIVMTMLFFCTLESFYDGVTINFTMYKRLKNYLWTVRRFESPQISGNYTLGKYFDLSVGCNEPYAWADPNYYRKSVIVTRRDIGAINDNQYEHLWPLRSLQPKYFSSTFPPAVDMILLSALLLMWPRASLRLTWNLI